MVKAFVPAQQKVVVNHMHVPSVVVQAQHYEAALAKAGYNLARKALHAGLVECAGLASTLSRASIACRGVFLRCAVKAKLIALMVHGQEA